jgi:hypothetical protein
MKYNTQIIEVSNFDRKTQIVLFSEIHGKKNSAWYDLHENNIICQICLVLSLYQF